jgi:uncharacterized membrane protein (UPF0127 family)
MDNNSRQVTIQLLKNQRLIADKCIVADRFFSRLRGLIGRRDFADGEGIFFPRCNDIHMWFMSIPIDVIFVRTEHGARGELVRRVISTRESLRPWRVLPARDGRATDTIELPQGTIKRLGVEPGDELCIS